MATIIRRKAVPQRLCSESKTGEDPKETLPNDAKDIQALALEKVVEAKPPVEESELRPDLDEQIERLELETLGEDDISSCSEVTVSLTDAALAADNQNAIDAVQGAARKSDKMKAALGELKHFAGGLTSRPYESTKHYAVLRYSHGLVFYRGLTTSVAITIFSDQPLPADRRLWLQKRGLSGNTGLKIGAALGSRSAWIDVTPAINGGADLLPKDDERAWQRDIDKFFKKARKAKNLSGHRPYETDVVRIPHAAEDGYFRVVVCADRKVLCPSPVFRYASSSLDRSILRGASLSTLPLELGIRISSLLATYSADGAVMGVLQPTIDTVTAATQALQPSSLIGIVATTAYDISGAADKVDDAANSVNQQYDEKRALAAQFADGDCAVDLEVLGAADGPEPPYPIQFSGKVAQEAGIDDLCFVVPGVHLVDLPEDTLLRLSGVYVGWACVAKTECAGGSAMAEGVFDTWHQAIVVVGSQLQVVPRKRARVHLLHDFEGASIFGARLDLMLMGCLRPAIDVCPLDAVGVEHLQIQMVRDIAVAKSSLNRPAWHPEMLLQRIETISSKRTLSERLADARQSSQKQLDKVPFHKLGVRTDSMGYRDRLVGKGRICVKR
ncbi:hypothetical protein LTR37_012614 [Vermiconidia calcicola]|uniref:Uncharacterized protein n=1 Tax=Vermiconidia calcicola TaxID=1690605 RepID=A0ACC3MYR5_9PEZI|nr:hypothetical protein LTR37_012614 [Vermiconidia calcicola]